MKNLLILFFLLAQCYVYGQKDIHTFVLDWTVVDDNLTFTGAQHNQDQKIPTYSYYNQLPADAKVSSVRLQVKSSEEKLEGASNIINPDFDLQWSTEWSSGFRFLKVEITPIRKTTEGFECILMGQIHVEYINKRSNSLRGGDKTESVLNDGTWFKLKIHETGMHKITGRFLQNQLGLNLSSISPSNVQVFGNKGGRLPESSQELRTDDLEEIPTRGVGLGDGQYNDGDYLIFYAEAANAWKTDDDLWVYETNIYDDYNYVFIRIDGDDRKEIDVVDSEPLQNIRTSYIDHQYYGKDELNLLGRSIEHQGSGQMWLSDEISNSRTFDLMPHFDFRNVLIGSAATFTSEFYGRSESRTSYNLVINDTEYSKNITGIDYDPEAVYARPGSIQEVHVIDRAIETFRVDYPETSHESEGWVDFISVIMRKSSNALSDGRFFRDTFSDVVGGFQLSDLPDRVIWEVTDYHDPYEITPLKVNGSLQFATVSPNQREFVVFNPNNISLEPTLVEELESQNLHAMADMDMIIITPGIFMDEAIKLQAHRSAHNDLQVEIVEVDKIYNEFSSGRQDPTAIRDFCKHIYDKSSQFKYLLLLGDGSYDWKHLVQSESNQNMIPVYETEESLDPIYAYPTDDYYALLDDDEGATLGGDLDIAVGRLLCRTQEEAKILVDKIIRYDSDPNTLGDWRNRQIYMADDEDSNRHIDDIDQIAVNMDGKFPAFNQDKIYFDAYEQVATPGGARYPDAKAAINTAVFKGALVMVYLGHGGPTGLAQERVLQTTDIRSWKNFNAMPIIITATCTFTGYDNPAITTAGEYSLLNPDGGAVAILSTVRAVYAQDNFVLTNAVHQYLYERDNGKPMPIGEIMRLAKNSVRSGGDDSNNRKFSLFGDPSMSLAIPRYQVATTTINGQPAAQFKDTVGSLESITVSGYIAEDDGSIMTDFNGTISPTVFDKALELKTKVNDRRSKEKAFQLRKNVIFKGTASVENGEFSFTFVVPKDINFSIGNSKISYYAHDGDSRDANGNFDGIVIGGLGNGSIVDDQAPEVKVFMNNNLFQFGDKTTKDPILYLELKDDYGINVVGNSIGHDLTAVLDNNTQNTYILNDFYEAKVDDYKEGTVRFPFKDLENGRHSIKVTAWDIANNFSEGYTEFVVVDNIKSSLQHVFTYPNPFIDHTTFSFMHTLPEGLINIDIEIYNAEGKLIKRIKENVLSTEPLVDSITWDGRADNGQVIAKGVYLYKIKVSNNVSGGGIQNESEFERLVVLK